MLMPRKVKGVLYSMHMLLFIFILMLTAMTFTVFVWGLEALNFKKIREKVSNSLGGSIVQAKEKPTNQPSNKINLSNRKNIIVQLFTVKYVTHPDGLDGNPLLHVHLSPLSVVLLFCF